jgi:chromosome segregation ATPase
MPKTIAQLQKELVAKEEQLERLQAARKKLASHMEKLDREIAALCGKQAVKKRRARRVKRAGRRARSGGSLGDVLAQVLKGKGSVRVGDAAKMALEAGYKTTSKQFGNIVSQALATDERFKRVRRGLFKLK